MSDGAEQYAAMPGTVYQRLREDVETYLYTPGGDFARIDMAWANQALELLHELGGCKKTHPNGIRMRFVRLFLCA